MNHPAGHPDTDGAAWAVSATQTPVAAGRTLFWINLTLTLLIVAALIFCGIQFLDTPDKPDSNRAPDIAVEQRLRDRVGDPEKLRRSEMFDDRGVTIDSRRYTVSDTDRASRCDQVTHGQAVPAALAAYGCEQVLRATLVDASGQFAATWGIADLADAPSAAVVDTLLERPSDNGGFTLLTTPLIEPRIGTRKTVIAHQQVGHYVLFVIVIKLDVADYDAGDGAVAQISNDAINHLKRVVTAHASGE